MSQKMNPSDQQLSIKILIIYMISALLFLTSVELHIHTQKAAAFEGHGAAVSISHLYTELLPAGDSSEIKVSPDAALKLPQNSFSLLATFLLITLLAAIACYSSITRFQILKDLLPDRPFHGAALLRAPPQ